MEQRPVCELASVQPRELAAFKRELQRAFTFAAREFFPDLGERLLPPIEDVEESLGDPAAEALHIVSSEERIGGAIVRIDPETGHNSLDFLFIAPEHHNKGIGLAAWRAIEAHYPATRVWELVTPYHEQRNIHFYVNRCGFSIVEYYNPRHPDPWGAREDGQHYPGEENGLLRFEKHMG